MLDKLRTVIIGRYSNLLRIGMLLIVVILVLIGVAIYHDVRPTPYQATKSGFQITFPGGGIPQENNIASKSDGEGGTESGQLYSFADKKTGAEYAIYVLKYSDLNAATLSSKKTGIALLDDLNQLAETDNAKISSAKLVMFNKLTAVSATITPSTKTDKPTMILSFLKNHDLFLIFVSGASENQFKSFTDSFQFNS